MKTHCGLAASPPPAIATVQGITMDAHYGSLTSVARDAQHESVSLMSAAIAALGSSVASRFNDEHRRNILNINEKINRTF
jgi:hypothetical protein